MHGVVAVLCLVAAAVTLEGCGGDTGLTCIKKQMDIVSQSVQGIMEASMTLRLNSTQTTLSAKNIAITEKIDVRNWNMRTNLNAHVTEPLPGLPHYNFDVEMRVILAVSKHLLMVWEKSTNNTIHPAKTQERCWEIDLPLQITPQSLTLFFTELKTTMQAQAECGGNDGTYDTWKIHKTYSGPIPKVPFPTPVPIPTGSIDLATSMKFLLNEDYLLHSGNIGITGTGNLVENTTIPVAIEVEDVIDMQVNSATAGGPTDADLDYSEWAKDCTKVPVPHVPPHFDADSFFRPTKGSEAPLYLQNIMGKTFFQKHVTDTMKALLKAQPVSRVLV